jgi:hypothetical protein
MDVAIRVVNWLWGYQLFRNSKILTDDFSDIFQQSLFEHGRHIYENLENEGKFTTNHYISDLVGLVYLGVLCPSFKMAAEWRSLGLRELWHELMKQVTAEGVDFEGSIPYHRLVTELYLSTVVLCQVNHIDVPQDILLRLEKMLDFTMNYTKPDGTVPLVGDADNGRLHRLKSWHSPESEWLDHRYLLAIGAVLFDRHDFAQGSGSQWEEAIWIFARNLSQVERHMNHSKSEADTNAPGLTTCVNYPESGYYIAKNRDFYLLVRGGSTGTDGLGNHTHNDVLSLEWAVNGISLIRDAGTGVYTSDYRRRYTQRSVRSHSTVCIDDLEPGDLRQRAPFMLTGSRKTTGGMAIHTNDNPQHVVECDLTMTGYKGLPTSAAINRKIYVGMGGYHLRIIDTVQWDGTHLLGRFFVIGSAKSIQLKDTIVTCLVGAGTLHLEFQNCSPQSVSIEGIDLSDSYGRFRKGFVVRCHQTLQFPSQVEANLWYS